MKALNWHRDGEDWILLCGRRRFGRVVPDSKYSAMYRSVLSGGRLSDMANLAWAKNAVLVAAEREMEYEARVAIGLAKCPEKRGVFQAAAPPIAPNGEAATPVAGASGLTQKEPI
jgi:hypothetical protein